MGHRQRLSPQRDLVVETNVHHRFEDKRIKHLVDRNSLKQYTHVNVLRTVPPTEIIPMERG
jgi:hypothetical protein